MNIPIEYRILNDRILTVSIPDPKAEDATKAILGVCAASELTFLQSLALLENAKIQLGHIKISGSSTPEEK